MRRSRAVVGALTAFAVATSCLALAVLTHDSTRIVLSVAGIRIGPADDEAARDDPAGSSELEPGAENPEPVAASPTQRPPGDASGEPTGVDGTEPAVDPGALHPLPTVPAPLEPAPAEPAPVETVQPAPAQPVSPGNSNGNGNGKPASPGRPESPGKSGQNASQP